MDTAWFVSTVLLVLGIILALVRAFIGYLEAHLLFYSETLTVQQDYEAATAVGLNTECLPSGATLWSPKVIDATKPRILFLHGNNCCLRTLTPFFRLFIDEYNIFATDYRGFGKAAASRSCAFSAATVCTVNADAWEAWLAMVSRGPTSMYNIIAGHSLGSAIAIDLAARVLHYQHKTQPLSQLILMNGWASFTRLVNHMLGGFSACLPLSIVWESSTTLESLNPYIKKYMDPPAPYKPVVVVHSRDDGLIPFQHAVELANVVCAEFVDFVELPSGSKCSKACLTLEPVHRSSHACAVIVYKNLWTRYVLS